MRRQKWVRIVAIIVGCVLLDIGLHLAASPWSTAPPDPSPSPLAERLGVEAVATLWALLAFTGAALVFLWARAGIPGRGIGQGLRYGGALALLWLCAMLEGVSLFGNPLANELVTGLSDAIPALALGALLGLPGAGEGAGPRPVGRTPRQAAAVLGIFVVVFLAGRYAAYGAGAIASGWRARPLETLVWTALMGSAIGAGSLLLRPQGDAHGPWRGALRQGAVLFGVNWATFLLFMPLMFRGYLADVVTRIALDILIVTLAHHLAFRPVAVRTPGSAS